MSVQADQLPRSALDDYRARLASLPAGDAGPVPAPPSYDELLGPDGVRAEHEALAGRIDELGAAGLLTRARQACRFVQSDGITYGSVEEGAQAGRWRLDPLPVIIGAQEWSRLELALTQRVHLLDLILTDLYGERTLLHRRVLPPEVVLGHPGFVRQADRIRLPGAQQLFLAATDLARTADGSWRVIADRTQAPSGAGYAMANRRIVARTMPRLHRQTDLSRLRGFFDAMRAALQDFAPESNEAPRVVVHSPGGASETAFDQAFTATLLGFPLVESDDLTMRDGRVWVRTTGSSEPVDVILRRVDATWSDPLELRADSQLGVPGLVEAARRGKVAVANPLGAGVLENPALQHFLGDIAREVLGEDLALAAPESWWCGDDAQRSHVLSAMDELVIKQIDREHGPTRFGWQLSSQERDELRREIEAQSWRWVGQRPLPSSSAPVISAQGLEPRRLVLRSFAVAQGGGYHFMPGGLARVAAELGQQLVTSGSGALAKDVWVLSGSEPPNAVLSLQPRSQGQLALSPTGALSPRIAADLFWMGRYAERAEGAARLLKVADDLAEDYGARPRSLGGAAMAAILEAVTAVTTVLPGFIGEGAQERMAAPVPHLRQLVTDSAQVGSVGFAVAHLVRVAQQIRDQLSLDTWPVLARLEQTLAAEEDDESQLQDLLEQLLESLLALAGITSQSMIRDRGWSYLDAGVRLERAQLTVALLSATVAREHSPVIEGAVAEAVLVAGESTITHRRRASTGHGPSEPRPSALQLLLRDRTNPRSVAYQLDRLGDDFRMLGDDDRASEINHLTQALAETDGEAIAAHEREPLTTLLEVLDEELRALGSAIEARHFTRQATQRTHLTEWTFGRERD